MGRRDRIWTPRELDHHVRTMGESLQKLSDPKYGYKEAHAYTRGDRRDAPRTDENQGFRVSTSEVSDPTADQVVSQEWNRARLVRVATKLQAAAKMIDDAVSECRGVFSHPDDYFHNLESYRG